MFAAAYVCDGFVAVDVPPSPEFNFDESVDGASSVLLSVKLQPIDAAIRE